MTTTNGATASGRLGWRVCGAFLLSTVCIIMPEVVLAGANTPLGNVLCTTQGWFTGNVGKGLATICVTTIGVLQLLGKRKRTSSIRVAVGVAIIFGAAGVINMMGGGVNGLTNTGQQNCT